MSSTELKSRVKKIIDHFDPDPNREGLKNTPYRYVKFLEQFLNPPPFNFTVFDSEGMDEMIIVRDIHFYSLCEHHLSPFFGLGHIAYIPDKKIAGISKLPRVLDLFSRRFQNQERITQQVAKFIQKELSPKGVAVSLSAQHMCMEMRGIKAMGAKTVTSCLLGSFKDGPARSEFLHLINGS